MSGKSSYGRARPIQQVPSSSSRAASIKISAARQHPAVWRSYRHSAEFISNQLRCDVSQRSLRVAAITGCCMTSLAFNEVPTRMRRTAADLVAIVVSLFFLRVHFCFWQRSNAWSRRSGIRSKPLPLGCSVNSSLGNDVDRAGLRSFFSLLLGKSDGCPKL